MNGHKLIPLLLFACGGEPIYNDIEDPMQGLTTPSRITSFLDGKTLTMEGEMIPTHPNGLDENVDYRQATQCYVKVVMKPQAGRIQVASELGTLGMDGCDHTRVSNEATFVSTAVLIENVKAEAECFDFTVTYPGFGQEGRGKISAEKTELDLEIFFKDSAVGHRCADGNVGDPTITLNMTTFTGDATQRYRIGE